MANTVMDKMAETATKGGALITVGGLALSSFPLLSGIPELLITALLTNRKKAATLQ